MSQSSASGGLNSSSSDIAPTYPPRYAPRYASTAVLENFITIDDGSAAVDH